MCTAISCAQHLRWIEQLSFTNDNGISPGASAMPWYLKKGISPSSENDTSLARGTSTRQHAEHSPACLARKVSVSMSLRSGVVCMRAPTAIEPFGHISFEHSRIYQRMVEGGLDMVIADETGTILILSEHVLLDNRENSWQVTSEGTPQ